jgi:hypothetical protein
MSIPTSTSHIEAGPSFTPNRKPVSSPQHDEDHEVAPPTSKKRKVNDSQMIELDDDEDEEGPVTGGDQDEGKQE